jgi:transposase
MVSVIKHITIDELKNLVRKEKNKHVHERLLFIHQLYLGDNVEIVSKRMCLAVQTGYNWLDDWNRKGYEGLVPRFGGGKPPSLSKNQREKLKRRLKEQGNWITSQVRALIQKEFSVTYSLDHVARILRGFGMNYAKPYPKDYRCPENAKELLAQSLEEAMKDAPSDSVIGFMDEASPQTTDNKQRFWSFGKPKMTKNTSRYKANAFGFYPINGKETVGFMERSTSKHVCEFLQKIRSSNPGRHVIVIVDNFRSHVANVTRNYARSIGITLIFLPPYSPHLNPIEFIWKSIRRRVSQTFVNTEWSLKETIRMSFHRLARKKSFMVGWLETFMPDFSK